MSEQSKTVDLPHNPFEQDSTGKKLTSLTSGRCAHVWFEPTSKGSILMLMTESPFLPPSNFETDICFGEAAFRVTFSFSGAISFEENNTSQKLYRATAINVATGEDPISPVHPLRLSGPQLPGRGPYA